MAIYRLAKMWVRETPCQAKAMAVDAYGNVYVTGESSGSYSTSIGYATIKYDTNGNELWAARYDGPARSLDFGRAMALDAYGNVYVTGTSGSYDTGTDYATIKYGTNGIERWVAGYNGSANSFDFAIAMAVDADGNVFVTGESAGYGTDTDYATIKYSQELDPVTAINQTIDAVIIMNLGRGIEGGLVSKLDAALQAIEDINENNNVAACNALEAFINAVEAQSGNKISTQDALDLINIANEILSTLECI